MPTHCSTVRLCHTCISYNSLFTMSLWAYANWYDVHELEGMILCGSGVLPRWFAQCSPSPHQVLTQKFLDLTLLTDIQPISQHWPSLGH